MKKLILLAASMAISSAAVAGPAWTFVDAGVVLTDSAGADTSAGGRITGSFGLDIFHANASWTTIDDIAVDGGEKVDYDALHIAFGIHPAITDSTDLVLEIGYTDGEIDTPGSDDPEPSSVDLLFGVRSMIADNFELNAAAIVSYGDLDDGSDDDDLQDVGIQIGGQYFFTDRISANVTATQGLTTSTGSLDGDSIQIGGRWSF
jgi:hypothetical protein